MNKLSKKRIILIFILLIISMGLTTAQTETYSDEFDDVDVAKWNTMTSHKWYSTNGMLSSTGNRADLIFKPFEGEQYLCEIDFTANKTRILDFAQVGFYFYYEDLDNYARVVFGDNNRGDEHVDGLKIESNGPTFSKTLTYINVSTNTSIEFDPNVMEHLKVVRLNKNIYVYFDNQLALTTEFKDDNPAGKVGFDIYECTGYFDNFDLHPITMNNASGYINEINLTSTNPTTRIGSIYTLRLDDIANENAMFSLSKFGKTIDSNVASEGEIVSLNFENGDEGVNFKVAKVFDAEEKSAVWLEDIISASTGDLNIDVDEITINPSYYQEEDMEIQFSVKNFIDVRYMGTPEITISTEGDNKTIVKGLDLSLGESEEFRVVLKAPQKQGSQKITVAIRTEYSTIEKSVDYQVRVINPTVTILSADLQEDNGIRGTISIGSPFPAELVDWDMMAVVKVYRVVDNGKKEIYSKDLPVTGSTFNIDMGYNEFYQGDGQYVVSVDTRGMQASELLEIVGEDFAYAPTGDEIPPTIFTGELYPKLIMLLIGMFAAVSVRNHMQRMTRSLPLDVLTVICGLAVLVAAFIRGESDMAVAGIVLTGAGIGAAVVRKSDSAVSKVLMMDSHLHDFAGMLLVFLSAGYIVMQVPEWSFFIVVGTLVGYYSALNLYRGR
ncbi:MAG: hypothetical protein JEY94_18800 [Melioribacteraceae bacterium]|nr:hypothetical protein [Melioribacteraceae bacterium]